MRRHVGGDGAIVWSSWTDRLGALAARAGKVRAAVDHLGAAIDEYDSQGCPVFAARARLERARLSAEHARVDLAAAAVVAADRGLPLIARDAAALLAVES